jgi:pantoate--beta-alanine ligase
MLFVPSAEDMYPSQQLTYVEVEELSDKLCGRFRNSHFKGVTTVVLKLFNIVRPDRAYFGQKDAQQAVIIKKMVRDLNLDIEISVLPIVREKDGLAMSSRNSYLDKSQRDSALVLYKALTKAQELITNGEKDSNNIKKEIEQLINLEKSAKIEYIEIVNMNSLEKINTVGENTLIALAVRIGGVRLIDNIVVRH